MQNEILFHSVRRIVLLVSLSPFHALYRLVHRRNAPLLISSTYNHRAQVHIRGYGAVHIGGAEFEARKRRKVDLISFDMVIKIKVVKFE